MFKEFEDPIKLLRMLKGAPLAVLLACIIAGGVVRADWVTNVTGYTDKTTTAALKLLNAYGFLTKSASGWQISKGVQMPLNWSQSEKFRSSSCSSIQSNILSTIEQEQQGRNNSDLENYHLNYKTLSNCGIREPALSRLAGLDHVTPEYILAHVREVTRLHGNLGTAIHRIENNWAAPEIIELKSGYKRHGDSEFSFILEVDND